MKLIYGSDHISQPLLVVMEDSIAYFIGFRRSRDQYRQCSRFMVNWWGRSTIFPKEWSAMRGVIIIEVDK